ncbi:hypothetical protein CY35_17G109900 [Sphagnum magellanicum]|nr:hypothetical protein CY35_17G109900 [Sphagnum magellanicum]
MGEKFMNGPPLLFVVCLRYAFLQSYKLEPPHVRVMTMGHRVTQAEIRFKDVKVKPLDLEVSHIMRFLNLHLSNRPHACCASRNLQ